ncbi:hypothetical protein WL1483_1455 [Aeromonas schubertii]|uniref:Uncharacterized protein n=1 Tax=Aeromonas schubertii TaxID=652 RepID=A0A0S2SGX4_9GAMM|nr:hypothetical protein WL1483_1455 [Aeromonas schubertii]
MDASGSGHVTTTALNLQAHADLSVGAGQVADYVLRVYDLNFITVSDITSGNGACSRLGQGQSYLVLAFQLHSDAFQVQQDFENVFLNTFLAAVLVQYAIDFDFSDCTTGHRRKQNTTQGVAQRVTKTTLKRLKSHFCVSRANLLDVN